MRTHTARHICGVIWMEFGVTVTGGNMEPGRGRLDFPLESMSTVDAGIETCFDSIDHAALMDRVRYRVKDKRVLGHSVRPDGTR